jgi:endonuclease YncB( thermonuclease family)
MHAKSWTISCRRALRRLLLAVAALWALTASRSDSANRWYTYDECSLIENDSNDGDSFHVARNSSHYIFRLYFVDTPESNRSYPERVKAQAEYWGISEAQVLKLATEAKRFSQRFLVKGFTVYSKREDARGRSDRKRYYAVVKAGGRDLAEALVTEGLARVYGHDTMLPDGKSAKKHWAELKVLERAAKRAGRGAWGLASGKTRLGSFKVRPVEPQDVVLPRSIALYSLDTPPRFLGVLKKGAKISVLEALSPTKVKARFELKGEAREGQCNRSALGI